MTLPNFLYIGAPRAGSTWIFEALRAHPQVFVPVAKYVKYFLEKREEARGLNWYESFFEDAGPEHLAIGEVTGGYLYSEDALRWIAEELPDVRLVASIRNPIERDWSAYLYMKRNSEVLGSFAEELNGKFRFIRDYGCYAEYLPLLFELFPRDRLKLLLFDDLSADPKAFTRDLYSFLGVDPNFNYTEAEKPQYAALEARSAALAKLTKDVSRFTRNAGMPNLIGQVKRLPGLQSLLYRPTQVRAARMLSPEDHQLLIEKHRDGIGRLEQLIDRDLSHWLRFDPT